MVFMMLATQEPPTSWPDVAMLVVFLFFMAVVLIGWPGGSGDDD